MAVMLDYTMVRRILTKRLETANIGTGGGIRHLGEDRAEGLDFDAHHIATNFQTIPRNDPNDQHQATFEFVVAVSLRETESTANIDAIDRAVSAVAEVFEQYGTEADSHRVECNSIKIETESAGESTAVTVGTVTVSGTCKRDSGATVTDPA